MNITKHSSSTLKLIPRSTQTRIIYHPLRNQSTLVSKPPTSTPSTPDLGDQQPTTHLQRISTLNLVRNILLGRTITSPFLFKYSTLFLSSIATSHSFLLDPDRNPLLQAIIKPLIYDHFCAGTSKSEISKTLRHLKQHVGFKGVILIYSREIPALTAAELEGFDHVEFDADVQIWLDGNLKTLDMIDEGDYIGVKFTGAGPRVSKALLQGRDPPTQLLAAMHKLCSAAQSQNKKLWIDAEQACYQSTINDWTVSLMRQYNTGTKALVSMTLQAYLKSAPSTLLALLKQASNEDWCLGVKLVRGAYISTESRHLIHDCKQDTDECYDSIAASLLKKSFAGLESAKFPNVELFLAGHNRVSIQKARDLYTELLRQGKVVPDLRFGQLMGMADDVSCELLASNNSASTSNADSASISKAEVRGDEGKEKEKNGGVQVYKCMNWGSVRECMHYLNRRASENRSAVGRMEETVGVMVKELKRRVLGF